MSRAGLQVLSGGPLEDLSAESRRQLIEEHVIRTAAAARARARGLHARPGLQARVRWQQARLLATDEIARRLNADLVAPTESEKRTHFEKNRDRYETPLRVDVSLIEWPVDTARLRAVFAQAETLLARIRSGATTFEAAAHEVSIHATAASGGRVGLRPMVDLAVLGPNVYRTVEHLSPGETSGLVQQETRLFAVKLWERQPARPMTYEEAARTVEKEVGDARVAALQAERSAEALRALDFRMVASLAAEPQKH